MTTKNNQGHRVTFFYAKYAYKTQGTSNFDIIYEGLLSNCPKDLLENIEINQETYKYVRVWTNSQITG